LCKQQQAVEESTVSPQRDPIFHTLINTCVENLILQKYFSSSSAQLLLMLPGIFDRSQTQMLQWIFGLSDERYL